MKARTMIIVLILSAWLIPVYADNHWTAYPQFGSGSGRGLAWGDFDSDGDDDIVILEKQGHDPYPVPVIYENNGPDDPFTVFMQLGDDKISDYGVSWADIDNDGDADLTIVGHPKPVIWPVEPEKPVRIYINDGSGGFSDTDLIRLGESSDRSESAVWADYDCDGFLDLFVANIEGPSRLYKNNGNQIFTEVKGGSSGTEDFPGKAHGAAFWDMNDDGRPDIALATEDGVYVLQQEHNSTYSIEKIEAIDNYRAYGAAWFEAMSKYDDVWGVRPHLIISGRKNDLALQLPEPAICVAFHDDGTYHDPYPVFPLHKNTSTPDEARGMIIIQTDNTVTVGFAHLNGYSEARFIMSSSDFDIQKISDEPVYVLAASDYNGDGKLDFAANAESGSTNVLFTSNVDMDRPPRLKFIGLCETPGDGWSHPSGSGVCIDMGHQYQHFLNTGMSSGNSTVYCPQSYILNSSNDQIIFPSGKTVDRSTNRDLYPFNQLASLYVSEKREISIYEDGTIEYHPGFIAFDPAVNIISGFGSDHMFRWADVDNDGYVDFTSVEYSQDPWYSIRIFKNNNNDDNPFELYHDLGLFTVNDLVWGDVDNDGDLDLAVACSSHDSTNKLIVNHWTENRFEILERFGKSGGAVRWADLDANGSLDLLVVGEGKLSGYYSQSAPNTPAADIEFKKVVIDDPGLNHTACRLSVCDYNEDYCIDVFGPSGLWKNDREETGSIPPFASLTQAFADDQLHPVWLDAESDGDQDLILTDYSTSDPVRAFLWDNEHTAGASDPFIISPDSVKFGQYNSPGDWNDYVDVYSTDGLYLNDSHGMFPQYEPYGDYLSHSKLFLADIDRDVDLDYYTRGYFFRETKIKKWGGFTIQVEGLSYQYGSGYSNRNGLGTTVLLKYSDLGRLAGCKIVGSRGDDIPGEVHFLGCCEGVYDIEVIFPSMIKIDKTVNPLLGSIYPLRDHIQMKIYEDGAVEIPGFTTVVSTKQVTSKPGKFNIRQNYPNPFNPVTCIQYTLPIAAHVEIRIFNALGQQVASLIDKKQTAGAHRIQWDGSGFPSGLYFYRIQAGEFCDTKKCLLLK